MNLLCTALEFAAAAGYTLTTQTIETFAHIISWNIFQMDGLSLCVPFGRAPHASAPGETPPLPIFAELEEPEPPNPRGHARIFDWTANTPRDFADLRQKGCPMKFDYIIGNPPYQEEQEGDNATYAPPIYHQFMDATYALADKVELISPARFLFDAGSTPKAWNKKMLADPHLKVLHYEADSSKVFPAQDIKGGVAITYRDTTQNFGAIEHFIVFDELRSIVDKVAALSEPSFADIILASESYRFTDAMHKDIPEAEALLSKGHKYDFKTSVFESLADKAFFEDKPSDGEYVQVIGLVKNQRCYRWIKREYVQGPPNFEHYKVFVPKSNGSGALGEVLSTPLIGLPLIGHTQSFISIGDFDTEAEAQACLKYVKGRFARTLLGVLKVTQDNPARVWRYVPLQDFTSASDIDWSVSVADVDKQLYKKYGLSKDEIDFIESHVKEMV